MKYTKKQRREIQALHALCASTFDRAVASGHQQAEAWSAGAVRESRNALLDFDAQDFRYVAGAIEAARCLVNTAIDILDRISA
jgi:hypothetical protein